MKSKLLLLSLSVAAGVTLLSGCGSQAAAPAAANTASTTTTTAAKTTTAKADAATGASQTTDEASFEKAVSDKNGNYVVIANKDLTFTKDLTVESATKKGQNGTPDTITRSLGLAALDSSEKITKKYTLTVPNLVFKGENGKVEYGIVKGDVYVQAKGFSLKGATIDGNLYFANDDLKNAFKLDAASKVTGQIAIKAYTK